MASRAEPADVLIVGGGIIGCTIGWRLAQRGARVRILERGTPGLSATWAAAGMLSPTGEAGENPAFSALAHRSLALYPQFVAELADCSGHPIEYAAHGKLEVGFSNAEAAALHERFAGVPGVQLLNAAEVRACNGLVSERAAGGIFIADDQRVDNRALGAALWSAAAQAGVVFELGVQVVALDASGAHVTARLADGGSAAADVAIVAAGCWSGQIAGLPGRLPVHPVRGQMVALRLVPAPFVPVLQSSRCYMIPRAGGRVLVGATVEQAGFVVENTSGGVRGLLNAAVELVPALEHAALVESWAGLRPGTPDDLPVLGADPALPRIVYATGHYRNGILLAPVTAELICAALEGRPDAALEAFSVARFRGATAGPDD